ncbi:hypothetical protein [Nocardioides sp. B-3]|uniref:hypothetical protein n=1 Tax=Nocardioides sp. B-3 TaxID=2895565 RepID=UPI002152286A|nr:hypothetical protein [Nocardioides sp. B-3]UUZ59785.1 hypothetical protein LP418_01395 [Nocardioides sp. B-3]
MARCSSAEISRWSGPGAATRGRAAVVVMGVHGGEALLVFTGNLGLRRRGDSAGGDQSGRHERGGAQAAENAHT